MTVISMCTSIDEGLRFPLSAAATNENVWFEPTPAKLQAISKICVFMPAVLVVFAHIHPEMQREAEFLRAKGTVARATP